MKVLQQRIPDDVEDLPFQGDTEVIDKESLSNTFKSFNPEKVVNLAAQAGVRYSIENPYAYLDSNLIGFVNILEMCRHHKGEGLIYASSSSVYGANKKIPCSVEDYVFENIIGGKTYVSPKQRDKKN